MYNVECLRLLNNDHHYKRLSKDPTETIMEEITFLIDKGINNGWITKHEASFLTQPDPKTAYFYILPKIHKNKHPPPGRPIVSGIGSILEPLSQFCDWFLQPFVKQIPTYLKDTTDVLALLNTLEFDKEKEHLMTLDVESLYTNIPQEATFEVINNLLNRGVWNYITPPEFILDLAHLALTRNFLEFDKNFFLQIQGTSMGSTFAPSLACLYVDHFEKEMVLTKENPYVNHIRLWKRYIDDILIIWKGTKEEATTFITWLNTLNPFLRFTATLGDPAVSFLDLLITERNGSLTTVVYYKPTDRNTLLQFQSFHPRSLRENLPVGQFLRLRRNCTELTDYKKHAQQLTDKLRARGYPDHLLRRADKRARVNPRETLLQSRSRTNKGDRLICVTTFNPASNTVKKIINDDWKILTSGGLPFQAPLNAYRKATRIQVKLIEYWDKSDNHLGYADSRLSYILGTT
ncbi:hypothetical protein NDU88_007760 [Pleurodeles waltl]|uniref:Reverse transcriptase domain-containing protein n=1 Tax=Pleurodeles waltl TaxID=8319 RepID=A0AAV7RQD2_PLEWA|nr:hypothetical protein NDU88_007760 [Pleurodeles waltl]